MQGKTPSADNGAPKPDKKSQEHLFEKSFGKDSKKLEDIAKDIKDKTNK